MLKFRMAVVYSVFLWEKVPGEDYVMICDCWHSKQVPEENNRKAETSEVAKSIWLNDSRFSTWMV